MHPTYKIEFIRYIDGYADPEILYILDGVFPSLDDAVMEGTRRFGTIHEARGAQGFRVVASDAGPVAHRFRGDSSVGEKVEAGRRQDTSLTGSRFWR